MQHVSDLQLARLEQMFRKALDRELTAEERCYLKFSLRVLPLQEDELQAINEFRPVIEKRFVEEDTSRPAKLRAS